MSTRSFGRTKPPAVLLIDTSIAIARLPLESSVDIMLGVAPLTSRSRRIGSAAPIGARTNDPFRSSNACGASPLVMTPLGIVDFGQSIHSMSRSVRAVP